MKGQSLARLIESAWSELSLLSKIWDDWGIQSLVAVSFFYQVILVLCGANRRRSSHETTIRLFIWASYLLASHTAAIALGNLARIPIRTSENPLYDIELQALLAPLLLMHLSNPDCISAYSVEDTKMAPRNGLKLLVLVVFVIMILDRCFDNSSPISMSVYLPLLIAGIMKPLATIFTLSWVYDDTISVIELKEIKEFREFSLSEGEKGEDAPACLHHVLMAYHRFDCLRPHRVNWFYRSAFVEDNWMSVDVLKPEDAFHVTEIELGFVYDAIYTQLPIHCTKKGLWSRVISTSCLVCALCEFSMIFRSEFLLDPYVTYTYTMLILSIIIELYQILTLSFSYTAIIALWKWSRKQRESCKSKCYKILEILHGGCKDQKLWSKSMGQLNLVEYCLKVAPIRKPVRSILSKVHAEAGRKMKKCWGSTFSRKRETVDSYLKVTIMEKLRDLEQKRKIRPFEDRGLWTLQDLGIETNGSAKRQIFYLDRDLDKCIIIWHIATDILLLHSSNNNLRESLTISCCCGPSPSPSTSPSPSPERERPMLVSKLLSNYMTYLLMDHPYLLFLTTNDVTIGYASSILQALADHKGIPITSRTFQDTYRWRLLGAIKEGQTPRMDGTDDDETFLTKNWNVKEDVEKLVTELENFNEEVQWKVISGVWIEMLCCAAHKSQVYHHMKMLRKGGELITHVWLLLLHKTDKFAYQDEEPKPPTPAV